MFTLHSRRHRRHACVCSSHRSAIHRHTRSHMSLSEWTSHSLTNMNEAHTHTHTLTSAELSHMCRCTDALCSGVAVKLKSDPSVSLDSRHGTVYFSRSFFLSQFFRAIEASLSVTATLYTLSFVLYLFLCIYDDCVFACVCMCDFYVRSNAVRSVQIGHKQFKPIICAVLPSRRLCVSSCCVAIKINKTRVLLSHFMFV